MPRCCVPRGRHRHRLSRAYARERALSAPPQTWIELTLECARRDVETVCETLEATGSVSVTLEPVNDDEPQLEPAPGTTPLWSHLRVRALYADDTGPAAARAWLPDTMAVTNLCTRTVVDRDWVAAAREGIEPIAIGDLWIGPSWATPPPGHAVVRLEPGLAFGSGRHPTTRLCLERLVAAPPVDIEVIDYGSGSGILAIAAATLGAHRVWALDIDPQAQRATTENAHANGASDRVEIAVASSGIAPVALVVANILAGPLVKLAPELTALTAQRGTLVLSGLLETQADEVADAYRRAFDIRVAASCDGWVRLDGVRRSGSR